MKELHDNEIPKIKILYFISDVSVQVIRVSSSSNQQRILGDTVEKKVNKNYTFTDFNASGLADFWK